MCTQTWVWQALVGRGPREAPMEREGNIGCDFMGGQGWETWEYTEKNYADASQCSGDSEGPQRLEGNS